MNGVNQLGLEKRISQKKSLALKRKGRETYAHGVQIAADPRQNLTAPSASGLILVRKLTQGYAFLAACASDGAPNGLVPGTFYRIRFVLPSKLGGDT
jgi:hypothetical protein